MQTQVRSYPRTGVTGHGEALALLRAEFSRQTEIPDSEWDHFREFVHLRSYARGQHLARAGAVSSTLAFLVQGCTRTYYITDGAEVTRNFSIAPRFSVAYDSVLTGKPTLVSIEALEPVRALVFSGDVLASLYQRHHCWERLGRRMAEQLWLEKEYKELRFRVHSPEEHYRLLLAKGSPLPHRVPLRHLASYLGVTPETLSRIRARVRDERADASA